MVVPIRLLNRILLLTISVFIINASLSGAAETNDLRPNRDDQVHIDRATAKAARKTAAARRRRVIFNDDSEPLARPEVLTPDSYLSVRQKPMLGTQVDTIYWSALAIWGDAPVYDSKVQPIFGKSAHGVADASGEPWHLYAPNTNRLIESGNCPLQFLIEFAHKHRMEIFASIRMNDIHDSFIPNVQTIWKREHPEFLVKTDGKPPLHKVCVTAQDYNHPAVRERKFEIIAEICRRYDVDGIDLDFIRFPVLFSSVMQGNSASEAEVQIMTSLLDRIRTLADKMAVERGRPILVSARVPDTLGQAKRVGLDVQEWLKKDLVDLLVIGGGYSPYSLNIDRIVQMAHRHDVLIYPCINHGPLRNIASHERLHLAARAVAMNWLQAGADGIYLWNLGTSFTHLKGNDYLQERAHNYAMLYDIGNMKSLRIRDKLYAVDGPVFAPYAHASTQSPLPLKLSSQTVHQVSLRLADNVQEHARTGLLQSLELRLSLSGPVKQDSITIHLNDHRLTAGVLEVNENGQSLWKCSLAAPPLQQGENQLEFSLRGVENSDEPTTLHRVHLAVDYQ